VDQTSRQLSVAMEDVRAAELVLPVTYHHSLTLLLNDIKTQHTQLNFPVFFTTLYG